MIGQPPPYALATPVFRFRALVSHAGRAALGGDREVALACFVAGRVAAGMLPPFSFAPADSATRITSTRQWLASVAVPQAARIAAVAAVDAVSAGDHNAAAAALSHLCDVAATQLDQASRNEIGGIAQELRSTAVGKGAS